MTLQMKNRRILCVYAFVSFHVLGSINGNFIIERKIGDSDEIILLDKNKDPLDILAGGTFKDHRTCRADTNKGNIRRNIGLSSQDPGKKISCYTEGELQSECGSTNGNEFRTIPKHITQIPTRCSSAGWENIKIWGFKERDRLGWQELSNGEKRNIRLSSRALNFDNRRKLDGLLGVITYTCPNGNVYCDVLKFAGAAKYPLPYASSIDDLVKNLKQIDDGYPIGATPPTPGRNTRSPVTRDDESSNNSGLIIGIVFGIFVVIFAMVLAFFLYRRRKRSRRAKKQTLSPVYAKCEVDINSTNGEEESKLIHQYTDSNAYALPSNPQPEYREIEPEIRYSPRNNHVSMETPKQNNSHYVSATSTQTNSKQKGLEAEYQTPDIVPSPQNRITSEISITKDNITDEALDYSVPDKTGKSKSKNNTKNDTPYKEHSVGYSVPDKTGDSEWKDYTENVKESSPEYSVPGSSVDHVDSGAADDETTPLKGYSEPGQIIDNGKSDNDNDDDDDEVNYYSTPVTSETDALVRPNSALYAKVNKNTKR
eukprot:TCONS_00066966-protein